MFERILAWCRKYIAAIMAFATIAGVVVGGYKGWYEYTALAQQVKKNTESISLIEAMDKERDARTNYFTSKRRHEESPKDEELKNEMEVLHEDWTYWKKTVTDLKRKKE